MAERHTLWYEGAPHGDDGVRIITGNGRYLGVAGVGRARCSCGELSPVLPSAYQRKAWHRAHKADAANDGRHQPTCSTCVAALDALRELVALKDGPRDAQYERRKPLAWEAARRAVKAVGR